MLLGLCNTDALEYKFVESESGKPFDLEILTEELLNYDVVFFGELHDDSLLHSLEADLFNRLVVADNNVILSMEMFERDNQTELTNYVQGKMNYSEFTKTARLWPNHQTDYEPLLQIAKKNKRDVIAANVPRKYASMLAKQGDKAFETIDNTEKKYFASKLVVLDDRYKEEFYATMSGMGQHGMPNMGGKDMLLNIYKAQCLKDDTMAESIDNYITSHKASKVFHVNGDFHSRYYLGTAQKLALLNKNLKIAVIAPVSFAPDEKLKWSPESADAGDYLILFHRKAEGENN
jgi:uncharacterized iron-regulated protein